MCVYLIEEKVRAALMLIACDFVNDSASWAHCKQYSNNRLIRVRQPSLCQSGPAAMMSRRLGFSTVGESTGVTHFGDCNSGDITAAFGDVQKLFSLSDISKEFMNRIDKQKQKQKQKRAERAHEKDDEDMMLSCLRMVMEIRLRKQNRNTMTMTKKTQQQMDTTYSLKKLKQTWLTIPVPVMVLEQSTPRVLMNRR